ncbi:hypothetical protein CANTEDRAFT_114692 [Yamadazyma tenuis ATCC 10573]|uniref:Chitin synthase export chaperone n=1 Tax=Candida tenuis (strain ATCC 10573 / BCRC 21748 / CBS 615 / JCM 9827 / NBRC 10315 / NRRL Y-1498 / VKM Y-70) TaxID=590646 RepID=G3B645_CANTC|nr:uncharacterized protein CANTEDRAFT_114692 [Yamadazyma tenuis ATCC 10573]EGV63653.1 hypothetical protein CANTEDRAFT_114692 [Yamadazyma tenuis ATCC 10573]
MTFGSFEELCKHTSLPLCSVISTSNSTSEFTRGVLPQCYSRSVELANTMIFSVGNAFIHFATLGVLLIILFNVRAKYTAIGRTEMLFFFYLFIGLTVSSLVVDCGVTPPSSSSYAYFVAVQMGLAGSCCISLLYNGLLCFQFWEDGSRRSMWILRLVSIGWFIVNFFIAIFTFKNWGTGLSTTNTTGLFVVGYVLNAFILFVYVVSQVALVLFALDSYWPLGAICLGVFFFVAGQVLMYVFSEKICEGATHYIDGVFFATVCNTFTVMMIYKFWDMITTDDLEFSVATVENGVRSFGLEDEKRNSTFFS